MAERVINKGTKYFTKFPVLGHASNAPNTVPTTNAIKVATDKSPIVQGTALIISFITGVLSAIVQPKSR